MTLTGQKLTFVKVLVLNIIAFTHVGFWFRRVLVRAQVGQQKKQLPGCFFVLYKCGPERVLFST